MDATLPEPRRSIARIMRRHGSKCTEAEFAAAVDVKFHKFELDVHGQESADTWRKLYRQFRFLIDDHFAAADLPRKACWTDKCLAVRAILT